MSIVGSWRATAGPPGSSLRQRLFGKVHIIAADCGYREMSLAIAAKVFPLRLYLEMLIPAIEFPRAMYLVSKTEFCCLEPSKSVWSVFITTGLCPFTLPWG